MLQLKEPQKFTSDFGMSHGTFSSDFRTRFDNLIMEFYFSKLLYEKYPFGLIIILFNFKN